MRNSTNADCSVQCDPLVPLERNPGRKLRAERDFPSAGHQNGKNGETDDAANNERGRDVPEHDQTAQQHRIGKSNNDFAVDYVL